MEQLEKKCVRVSERSIILLKQLQSCGWTKAKNNQNEIKPTTQFIRRLTLEVKKWIYVCPLVMTKVSIQC